MRLQVVEDDAVLRDGLQVGLTACGWTVEAVCGAEDALAAIAPPFDAIVLDLGLPDGDGLEVMRRMQTREMDAGVLILSARDAVTDRIGGLDAGADDYLVKSFDLDEVATRSPLGWLRISVHLNDLSLARPRSDEGRPAPAG